MVTMGTNEMITMNTDGKVDSMLDARTDGGKIKSLRFTGFSKDVKTLIKTQLEFDAFMESAEFKFGRTMNEWDEE